MAISEDQLQTWSNLVATKGSKKTYRTIEAVLKDPSSPYAGCHFDVFLQGSYGNDTNIYAESDVDIVICLTDVLETNIVNEPVTEKFYRFKEHVFTWLQQKYGNEVKLGKKAIFIQGKNSRRDADVVVCIQYCHYDSTQKYIWRPCPGICFFKADGTKIVNFPQQHKNNLTEKNRETHGRFKKNVRVLKNMREAMVDHNFLEDGGVAPSYFLEGMLWNVPKQHFAGSLQETFNNYLLWLENCEPTQLTCANKLNCLIRDECQTCWNTNDFKKFISSARRYWDTRS